MATAVVGVGDHAAQIVNAANEPNLGVIGP
jgi:hypothetical protein